MTQSKTCVRCEKTKGLHKFQDNRLTCVRCQKESLKVYKKHILQFRTLQKDKR
jgi:Zn finger protein HypA/HybF involved in hydrogenase expression